MLALTAPRVKTTMATYDRQMGIDARLVARSNDAIARALEGGTSLTRGELGAVLGRARIKNAKGQRLAHLMMAAELAAVVCSGPRRGNESTYALLDERAPPVAPKERDESLGEMAQRYFTTRGPATIQDFSWWSGLRSADAKRAIAIAAPHLVTSTYEGRAVWFSDRSVRRSSPIAHLLPNYDEYFIGHKDRSAIGRRVRDIQEVAGDQYFNHLVFVDGELVGGWKRVNSRKGVSARLTMVAKLTAAERTLLEREVARFTRFAARGTAR
jgi:hypothetical protein